MTKSVAVIGTRGYPSYYGGFETAVRKLAPYLADQGWDVTVYGRRGATKINDPATDSRVKTVVTVGVERKSVSTLSYGLTAVLHALHHKPDVALVMNVANGFWLPLLRLRGIPVVVNVDGMEWERAKWGRLAKTIFRLGAFLTAKFATTLITDALEIQRRWQVEFMRDSVFIPYGGEIPGRLDPPLRLSKRKYVLLVARFVPENSVPEFFEAVDRISKNYQVVIVGSSGYGGDLDARAATLAKNENVCWLGHVSDDEMLMALWQNAGAYFHGHSVGGTNPALVQAMACGAPVVARDTVYNREVLQGTDAIFVNPDCDSIATGVEAMMGSDELQAQVSEKVKVRSEDEYSWMYVCGLYDATIGAHLTKVSV
ncbi:glycosyltransferase [Arthrobacter sp. Soil764]|uniref:glycosyltransferase n=1 Tax=Arthrobacter sp. Soil764 TaxID=1736403 RepID=UPI0009EBEF39|nr:glycosyltransferase [Arthrobacter sp. Soil764]